MYSTDFFVTQFRQLETEMLVERLATQELTDEARDALIAVLGERGHSKDQQVALVQQAKRDVYLKTGIDNRCDFCGKGLFPGAFRAEGQKFCNIDCFHTSRLHQAATDINDRETQEHALYLKSGSCPKCLKPGGSPDIYRAHFVASMVIAITTSTESSFTCRSCANRKNLWAALSCLGLGWWSAPGLFSTPFRVMWNMWEILSRKESNEPSNELVDWARLSLADAHLKAIGSGRYGLRA